jgi:hypothetical protein
VKLLATILRFSSLDQNRRQRASIRSARSDFIDSKRAVSLVSRGAVKIALKLRSTPDYGSRPLLQLGLRSFEEWGPDLHMQVLSQGNFFSHVLELGVLFQNLMNLIPEARVLAS